MTQIGVISALRNSYLPPPKKDEKNKEFESYKEKNNTHILNHEKAHQSAAGSLGGAIVIEKNSDGVAFAGHVPIQIPEVNNSNADMAKTQNEQVKIAALAPSDPSGQDYLVAAQAQANINKALLLIKQKQN